jgi:S1-C subfamily serine protease
MRWTRVIIGFCLAFSVGATPSLAALTQEPSANTKSAVVMIAIFDKTGQFTGWGSGFYVDERIVVTNKHVINDGQYYRVYGTGSNNSVDLTCFRNLTRSDVKINLDDDVAYIRATLPCDHGTLFFAKNDPQTGDNIGILGYPFKGSLTESLKQTQTTGTVLGVDGTGSWLRTSAFVDFGNSGGPVLKNDLVVGVVVAKSVDSSGNLFQNPKYSADSRMRIIRRSDIHRKMSKQIQRIRHP